MIETRIDTIVEDYHGTDVPDPYRWLEADNQETAEWVEAQNLLTEAFLKRIPGRNRIRERLTDLWSFTRYSTPRKRGAYYFSLVNEGLQNQALLYVQKGLEGDARMLLDPNDLSADGTVALTGWNPSKDGRWLAYGVSASGSDWQEIRIRNVETGEDLPEVLHWCKFAGIAWKHDGSGFYYNRHPDPATVAQADQNYFSRVCWHQIGTPQAADVLIHEQPEFKELRFYPSMSDDGQFLILTCSVGTNTETRIYYRSVNDMGPFIRLLDESDARYEFIGNDGSKFYFLTDLEAPRGKIIEIGIDNSQPDNWREIISESDETIDQVVMAGTSFVVASMRDAWHVVRLHGRKDGDLLHTIELPEFVTVSDLDGSTDAAEYFLGFSSFLAPLTPMRGNIDSGRVETLHEPALDFDRTDYETRQVFVTSNDGTAVPMFLTHRRDIDFNGTNPTLLSGYGGFNIPVTPGFEVPNLLWLELGGVVAVANLRGGGEYGEEWHRAGMLEKKQNVFDDFIACAEWLVDNGYTGRETLAIDGRSNGGLLVAACLTQRPDLYGAALCEVPVTDMLRYHRFTVGHYWTGEYGNSEENPDHFTFMHAYSPLHNTRAGAAYPPTLITSADSDDRVVPGHARKFAATLQAAQAADNPILLRVERGAGHGQGKPVSKQIDESTDLLTFLIEYLKMTI